MKLGLFGPKGRMAFWNENGITIDGKFAFWVFSTFGIPPDCLWDVLMDVCKWRGINKLYWTEYEDSRSSS